MEYNTVRASRRQKRISKPFDNRTAACSLAINTSASLTMSVYDELAEKICDDEWDKWKKEVLDTKDETAHFVARYRPGSQDPEVIDWMGGSFNLCLRVMFSNGGADAMIRFSGQGHSVFRDEKTQNEVETINFIHANTTIPVPHLLGWGLTKDSPRQLGPFIISEFVEGVSLSSILSDRTDVQKLWLNPNIDTSILDTVYEQIADFMLQLYQFDFSGIGAISKDAETGSWCVRGRPLTYSMNELATSMFYPVEEFPSNPFNTSSDYFQSLTQAHLTHLRTQRNFCSRPKAAEEFCSLNWFRSIPSTTVVLLNSSATISGVKTC